MKRLNDLGSHCNTCSACCTSKKSDKYRTPLFKSDIDKEVPTYEFNPEKGCYSCIHLSSEGRCNVYSSRPLICSLYPLYPLWINGKVALGVATAEFCGYGKDLYGEVLSGNEEIIADLRNKIEEIQDKIKISELKDFTKRVYSAYKTITILNI